MGMFEAGPVKAPLHRLTPLRDDPAIGWLSPSEKMRMNALAWFVWASFVASMFAFRCILRVLLFLFVTRLFTGRISYAIVAALTAALVPAVRRSILRMKTARVAELLRREAAHVAADDWEALAAQPEGQVASVLGWVRGRGHLSVRLGGESVVGVAVPCQSTFPGVLEAAHDFELCDEEGRTILIQVGDARTFGTPNVTVDGRELQMLFAALELPTGVTASAFQVHALRDGDPVMVVGFKKTIVDPEEASMRGEGQRLALGSSSPCPLLIFTIPAERRVV